MIKIVAGTFSLMAISLLSGCGPSSTNTNSLDGKAGSATGLSVSASQNGNFKLIWNRTQNVVYYYHTDLTLLNSNGQYRIAGTNTNSTITIECTKGVYSPNTGQEYSCQADNVPSSVKISLQDNEINQFVERGIYSSSKYGEYKLGTVSLNDIITNNEQNVPTSEPKITNEQNTTSSPEQNTSIETNSTQSVGSIQFNGFSYSTVTSPFTGRVWLDRNLGASEVCTANNDSKCYGDYYQWGRGSDGHEKSTSPLTSTLASNPTSVRTNNFIIQTDSSNNWDWIGYSTDGLGNTRKSNWSKTDGSGICPSGFRVPNIQELNAETIDLTGSYKISTTVDAFQNFLKLPAAGYRNFSDGKLGALGGTVFLWSTTTQSSTSHAILIHDISQVSLNEFRTTGYPVRCIKDYNLSNNTSTIQTDTQTNLVTSATLSYDSNTTLTFRGVATADNRYTYALSRGDTDNTAYLLIYDIAYLNQTEMPINKIKLSGLSGWPPLQHLMTYGNYLYVTGAKFRIYDISDRLNPQLLNTLSIESGWNEPRIENNLLYLPPSLNQTQSHLFDLSNPNKPNLLATLDNTPYSLLANNIVYSAKKNGVVTAYRLDNNTSLSQIAVSNNIISETPYYIYYFNGKLAIFGEDFYNGSKVYIYDTTTNKLQLLNTINIGSVRSSGCKNNICISGTQMIDLNNPSQGATTLNVSRASTGDGFPFQVNFTNNYSIRSGAGKLLVDKFTY